MCLLRSTCSLQNLGQKAPGLAPGADGPPSQGEGFGGGLAWPGWKTVGQRERQTCCRRTARPARGGRDEHRAPCRHSVGTAVSTARRPPGPSRVRGRAAREKPPLTSPTPPDHPAASRLSVTVLLVPWRGRLQRTALRPLLAPTRDPWSSCAPLPYARVSL